MQGSEIQEEPGMSCPWPYLEIGARQPDVYTKPPILFPSEAVHKHEVFEINCIFMMFSALKAKTRRGCLILAVMTEVSSALTNGL